MKTKHLSLWRIILAIVTTLLLSVLLSDTYSYRLSYYLLIIFLICSANVKCGITIQILSYFLLGYLSISLLDISHYRGVVSFETLKLYTLASLFLLGGLIIIDLLLNIFTKSYAYKYNFLDSLCREQKIIMFFHLFFVYIVLIYIYYKFGMILIDQELRFYIPTAYSYIIKSSIYIPLIYIATREKKTKKDYFLYILIPLMPALLIGSRGTVVMILIGVSAIYILQRIPLILKKKYIRFNPKLFLLITIIIIIIVYIPYYIRRLSPHSSYMTPSQALNEYFYSNSFVGYLIMPFHLGFKETIMLTNNIVVNRIENAYTDIPLFFLDLFTILPGQQTSAGQVIGKIFGTATDGGLTPGILGGLYIDFKSFSLLIILMLGLCLYALERLSNTSDKFLVLYVLSLIQFIHLFHRGFLKPEYIFSYLIIVFYLIIKTHYINK